MRSTIFFTILLLLGTAVSAQIHNDGAEIVIQSESIVYAHDLVNLGAIQNDGTFILTGDWEQYAGKYAGKGQVSFSGTSAQLVQINPTSVASVLVENPAGITLSGSLQITSELQLLTGLLHTSSSDTLLLTNDARLTGGSPTSFISGPLHRVGTGNLFFPIGWNDTYLPVTLEDIKGGNNVVIVLEAKSNLPASSQLPPTYELLEPYYWQRQNYKGTFGGARVVLPLFEEYADRSSIVMASASADLSAFDTPSEVSFITGDYYTGVLSLNEIYGEIIALAIADPSMADAAPFYVPNALNASAPEDDNRVIKVYGDILEENFLYVVFDRRGNEIFKTEDLEFMRSTGWDGRSGQSGKMAPAGSYIYAVKGQTTRGEIIDQTGQVIILK